jgi:hypothetical protein
MACALLSKSQVINLFCARRYADLNVDITFPTNTKGPSVCYKSSTYLAIIQTAKEGPHANYKVHRHDVFIFDAGCISRITRGRMLLGN